MLASRSISVADHSRGFSQETKHEQAQHPDVCAPGWSQRRSQVAHPFPSATTGTKRAGPAAWQKPLVKFSCSQIHIVSSERPQRATSPRSVHPATQVYHQPRLLSPTADSPCSFIQSNNTTELKTGFARKGLP
jgi:hypothetical protein